MKQGHAEVLFVVDRSGSMANMAQDMERGINQFIKDQAAAPGTCDVTLVQFDIFYNVVFSGVRASEAPAYCLTPRGSTALLDAIGRAVTTVGERLKLTPEYDRPEKVVVIIVTDGQENASREYTKDQIKAMIEEQSKVYKWEFVFLGANVDAFAEASKLGVPLASSMNYTKDNVLSNMAAVSTNFASVRDGTKSDMSYTTEQRERLAEEA